MSVSAAEFWFVFLAGWMMGAGFELAWLHLDRLVDALRHPDVLAPPGPGIIIPLHHDDRPRHVRVSPAHPSLRPFDFEIDS